jgi:beta-aspartyl-dipeptidase (metallo-type)
MTWMLLRGGHVFAPDDRGVADLLVLDDRIVAVGPALAPPAGVGAGETVDVGGRILLPGLIDSHLHVMGASGLGGPHTRTTDLQIDRIAAAGVTTAVSPLGADSLSRSIPALLARAAALDVEGLSAFCYTGGWTWPAPTLTGDPQCDVAYLDRVLGVKVAIAERLAPLVGIEDLCRLAHAAFTGGLLAGKRAVLHAHIGDHPDGLAALLEVHRWTGIPRDRLVATHVNRNPQLWLQAIEYAKAGGSIDVTALQRAETGHPMAVPPAQAIRDALTAGVPTERITMSTDSGAAYPLLDAAGQVGGQYMAGPDAILQTIRELVKAGTGWGRAAVCATQAPADLLGLTRKGRLEAGRHADVLVLSGDGQVERVFCRGRLLVDGGVPVVRGAFDGHRA